MAAVPYFGSRCVISILEGNCMFLVQSRLLIEFLEIWVLERVLAENRPKVISIICCLTLRWFFATAVLEAVDLPEVLTGMTAES